MDLSGGLRKLRRISIKMVGFEVENRIHGLQNNEGLQYNKLICSRKILRAIKRRSARNA
jgi:hypothetical protein